MKIRPTSKRFAASAPLLVALFLSACGTPEAPPAAAGRSAPASADSAAASASTPDVAAPTVEATTISVPLLEQELAYGEGQKTNLVGFLAMPGDAAEPLPGIILVHEWWGLNDDTKDLARRLAAERYVVLAVDLYGGQFTSTPEQAQALMATLYEQPEAVRGNLRQAYDYLEKFALAPRIGAMGFGMGGDWALQAGLMLTEVLDAVVTYHGQVVVDRTQLATLQMPILGFFGSEDRSVPVREVQEFRALLQESGKVADILIILGANQGFATRSSPRFNAPAATEAWTQTIAFLGRHLRLGDAVH